MNKDGKALTAAEMKARRDEEIDFSDIPEASPEFWVNAEVRAGPVPRFESDEAAERFVENADLSKCNLSDMKPMRFEFEHGETSHKTHRQTLKSELKRTGMTVIALLKDADDLPDGVNVRAVNRWIGGLAEPARQSQLDFVLDRLRALPDAPKGVGGHVAGRPGRRHPRLDEKWIEVTPEMRAQLRAEFDRTGLRFDTVLHDVTTTPEGLTARVVRGWLYGQTKTTRAAHWDFVMHRLIGASCRLS